MKPDRISIKWKLFGYLTLFAAAMLALLWLFQTVFLDSFYKGIMINRIKSYANTIEENIDNEELQTLVDRMAQQYDVDIRIIDENYSNLYSANRTAEGQIYRISFDVIQQYYKSASDNGGSFYEVVAREGGKGRQKYNNEHFVGRVPPRNDVMTQNMVYVKLAVADDGSKIMIILDSIITPVTSTVETLRIQLICITAVMLLLSIGLALIMSKRISKPIIRINNAAKQLAKGEYDVNFEGKGYLEIAELNSTLNYAAKELSKTESLRRELIANISHDLRTPLTMITGYAEVMRDLPGENSPENTQIIIDEAKRLSNLVNDVLDISKLQSGTQKLVLSEFNLGKSIRDILARYAKLTAQEGYNIEFVHGTDVFVKADESKLSQVVYNLINNAITYTGADKKVIVRQKVDEDRVRIEVSDTGEGIAQDKLPLIWDRYYKIDKAHKRAAMGTGLGLSIVKSILDLHDAKYGVASVPGHGSTFWFELLVTQK